MAGILPPCIDNLARAQRKLHGTIVDYTHHHGSDNRIWSPALCQLRDMYVYLPPGYDPNRQYPVLIWLHGFLQDENAFINDYAILFDRAISCGKLPKMIIAAPDGSIRGRPAIFAHNGFFINSNAGNFEDYLINDVWGFLISNYPIRPEREAHILGGISMGGFAAFNQAMKHRETFSTAVGVYPPLNLRWVDCHGRYLAKFDPNCWGWRESVDRGWEVIGRFLGGTIKIRLRRLIDPLFDRDEAVQRLSEENPAELLDRLGIQNGDLNMFVVFGGKDEFNLDAQIESFLYMARERGISVGYCYERRGHHNTRTALRMFPHIIDWLSRIMEPYRQLEIAEGDGTGFIPQGAAPSNGRLPIPVPDPRSIIPNPRHLLPTP
jgi:S-formylglutathione hydrolase FrmB